MVFNRRGLVYFATGALTTIAGVVRSATAGSAQSKASLSNSGTGSAHLFSFAGLKGGEIKLSDYQGKVVIIVNTASFCGFANQFKDLEALWTKYKDKGLVVIGVPCNDFGGQEPGTPDEIATFCTSEYGVDFPMTAKQVIKGENAHPFYKWATKINPSDVPTWNFFKYMLDKQGRIIGAFGTTVAPLDRGLITMLEVALAAEA